MKKLKVILFAIVLLLQTVWVFGTDFVWDGGGDGTSWTDDFNWDLDSGYPAGSGDTATFGNFTVTITSIPGGTAAGTLTVNDTNAQITFGAAIQVDDLIITNADTVTFTSACTAGTVTITAANSVTFEGALTATSLTTAAAGFTVSLNGGGAITNAVTFNNTGTLTLGNAAFDIITFTGGMTATAPSQVNLAGTVATGGGAGQDISLGDAGTPVVLTADTTLDAGAGNITLGGTVNADAAANNRTLTLNSTGTTTVGGAVGTVQSLFSLMTNAGGTTQLNGGAVTTTGAQTYNDAVSFGSALTLNSGGGAITFASTVDAQNNNLTIASGTAAGTVTFLGAVSNLGSGAGAALTVSNGVTGLVRFQSTVSGNSGIAANNAGNTVRFDNNVTLGDGNTGTAIATTQFDGLNFSGYDGLSFGAVTLSGGAVSITSNGSAISCTTITGAQNLTLDAGTTGTITVSGNVGATPLLTLTITNCNGATFQGSVSAGTLAVNGMQGGATLTVQGALTLTTSMTTAVGAYNIALNNGAGGQTSSIAGATTFNNTGTLTLGNAGADSITFNGGMTATAPSSVSLAGTIASGGGAGQDITINRPVVLVANTTLTAGAGNITLGGTVNADAAANNRTLTLNSTGTTTLGGAVGTVQSLLSVTTNAGGTTELNGGVVTTTGAQTYNDAVVLGADTTLDAGAGNITLGGTVNADAAVNNRTLTLNSTGTTTLGGAVGTVQSLLSVTTNAGGTTQLNGGAVTTTGALTYNDAVVLGANTTLAAGNITLISTVNPTTASTEGLTLLAGTGNISITGPIGNSLRLGALTVTSAQNVTVTNAVTAVSFTQSTGTGTTTFNGAQDYTGACSFNGTNLVQTGTLSTGGNFQFTGNALTVNNSMSVGGTTTITNAGVFTKNSTGTITSTGAFTQNGTGANSIGANITTTNTDLSFTTGITLTASVTCSTGGGAGNITLGGTVNPTTASTEGLTLLAGTGNISITGPIGNSLRLGALTVTSAQNVTVTNAVTAVSFTQSAGTGTTTFNGAQDYTGACSFNGTNLVQNGTLSTGGNFQFTGNALTVNNSMNVGGTTTITNSGVFTKNSTGTITSTGTFTQNGTGANSIGANITTTNTDLSFATGITLTASVTCSTGGGAGNITLGGTVNPTTASNEGLTLLAGTGNISITGPIGNSLRLGALTVTSAQNVTVTNSVTAVSFTQSAGTGTTTFNGAQDYTGACSFTGTNLVQTGTLSTGGNFQFTGSALTVNNSMNVGGTTTITNAGVFTKNSTGTITSTGTFTQNGTGANSIGANITTTNTDLSFATGITLTASVTCSTGGGSGNITLGGTVNPTTASNEGLTLTAGTGNISITGPIGNSLRLGALTVTSAQNVTVTNAVTAVSFTQSAGTGTTTFNSAQDYTGACSFTGTNLVQNGTLSTGGNFQFTGSALTVNNSMSVGGTTTITNAGVFTKNSTGTITSTGTFIQNGTGANSIGANITTTNTDLSFATGITLTASVTCSTGGGAGNITLGGTVNPTTASNEGLTLLAGTGNISITGPIGNSLRLGALTVTSAQNVTVTNAVTAVSFTQSAGTGTTTFNGAQDYTGACSFTGTNLVQTGTLSTGGNFQFTGNAFTVNNSMSVGGTISATATGAIIISNANITSTGAQTWTANAQGVRITSGGTWNAGGAGIDLPNTDIYLDHNGATLILGTNLSCRNFYFYRGSLNITGRTITASGNIALWGAAYNPNDAEWTGADTRHAYFPTGTLAYYPGGGTYNSGTGLFSTAPNAAFAGGGLAGSTLTITGNFYNNGVNMNQGACAINVPNNNTSHPIVNTTNAVTADQWGTPYAVIFNATMQNITASGWIAASSPGQGVTDGGSNSNIQFNRPSITWAATVYDDVIRVEFSQLIENDNNEISAGLVGSTVRAGVNNNTYTITGTYTDAGCTTSTDGQGDLQFFFIKTSDTWNTDATGSIPGAANSADRSNSHKTATADIAILKGALYAAEGKTMIQNYNYNGQPAYTGTVDRCRPALVAVTIGTAPHSLSPYEHYDGHNYIQLKYSEPVNIGNGAGFTIADCTAQNVKSENTFSALGEHGGYINGSGTLTLTGYGTCSGTVTLASRDHGNAQDNEVNGLYRSGPNAYGAHGLYISVAGWSHGADPDIYWPGYFAVSTTAPNGVFASVYNDFITDNSGNPLEPTVDNLASTISIPGASDGVTYFNNYLKLPVNISGLWDTTAPAIVYNNLQNDYDILPYVYTGGETRIEAFEICASEALRDTSITYPTTGVIPTSPAAFEFRSDDAVIGYRYGGNAFATNVQAAYFDKYALPKNVKDDRFFTIINNDLRDDWKNTSQFYFRYDSAIGLITDLAGNLLPTYTSSPEKACIEKIPPRIRLTTAIEGDTKLYVVFTEPVLEGPFPGTTSLTPADFTITGTNSFAISSITVLNLLGGGVVDCYLNLNRPITTSDMLYLQININNTIIDLRDNQADTALRRAVDIGMGVINVVAASDGIHTEAQGSDPSLSVSQLGTLRVFDGTGRLYDRDLTIYTALDISHTGLPYTDAGIAAVPLVMYFDGAYPLDSSLIFDIAGRDSSLQYWLPVYKPGFNRIPNTDARSLAPFLIAPLPSTNRNFLIPSADADMVSGTTIGFLFRYGDLFLAREAVPGDPRSFALWQIKIQDVIKQKGGVTILNNVINVLKRERTTVQLDLAQGGQVTVMVFTLDGDVVTTLHRGRLGAGTYNFVWDGTNMAGLPVARGIYFIRVVAPGIDEIRKVIVIKE